MKKPVILSLEQATALPYATMRFVQLGWRVIRIEATPGVNEARPGDPNRYVGRRVAEADRHALFVGHNAGKEAIAIDLKAPEGQALLRRLLMALDVDVFCCNTLPARYTTLGIDYETLAAARPELIWAGISALGPEAPDVAGYDPVIQAMSGIMDVTGFAEGPPVMVGLPITDLKSGDELYANVLLALLERPTAGGRRIDVAMLQAAVSWLVPMLALLDLGAEPSELTRCGNAHRHFVPTGIYATRTGFVYVAVGNDSQWARLVARPRFAALGRPDWASAAGRLKARAEVLQATAAAFAGGAIDEVMADLAAARIAHTRINDVAAARALPGIARRLNTTELGGGIRRLPPAAVDLPQTPRHFSPPPRYGEQTRAVFGEAGLSKSEIDELLERRILAAAV